MHPDFSGRFRIIVRMSVCMILCVFSQVRAEYIITKTHNAQGQFLSEQEYQKIYPILNKYSFPMNTNPVRDFSELSEKDITRMYKSEQAFLQEKIGPDYTVTFIPTTLYELFVIKFWLEIKLHTSYTNNYTRHMSTSIFGFPDSPYYWQDAPELISFADQKRPVRDLLKRFNVLWSKSHKEKNQNKTIRSLNVYNDINALPDVQAMALIVNNEIVRSLNQSGRSITLLNQKMALSVLSEQLDFFSYFYRNPYFFFPGTFPEKFLISYGIKKSDYPMLANIIGTEYEMHETGNFPVYRATNHWSGRNNRIDSTMTFRNNVVWPNSISYGNTIFDGLFGFDCLDNGAMPYHYLLNSQLGYILSINKYEYACKNLSDIFFVPPINTLASICGQGELFHTRTKGLLDERSRLCGIWFFSGYYYDIPEFLIADTRAYTQTSFERAFSDYLVRNIKILSNTSAIPTETFIQNQRKEPRFDTYCYDGDKKDSGINELTFPLEEDCLLHKKPKSIGIRSGAPRFITKTLLHEQEHTQENVREQQPVLTCATRQLSITEPIIERDKKAKQATGLETGIEIRYACEKDFAGLMSLDKKVTDEFFKPLFLQGYAHTWLGKHTDDFLEQELRDDEKLFANAIAAHGNSRLCIAYDRDNNTPAGLLLFHHDNENQSKIILDLFLIDKQYRRNGIGRRLIHAALKTFSNITVCDVFPLRFANASTLAFYEAMGFKKLGLAPDEPSGWPEVSHADIAFHYRLDDINELIFTLKE